jgi:hypothetical protein
VPQKKHKPFTCLLRSIAKLALNITTVDCSQLKISPTGLQDQIQVRNLTKKDCAFLLANAFFCTFPNRGIRDQTIKEMSYINFYGYLSIFYYFYFYFIKLYFSKLVFTQHSRKIQTWMPKFTIRFVF